MKTSKAFRKISAALLIAALLIGQFGYVTAYAKYVVNTNPTYWPGSASFSSMVYTGCSTASTYTSVEAQFGGSITAEEYPDEENLFLDMTDYCASCSPVKVIRIPDSDGSDPSDYELTLTVNFINGLTYRFEKRSYYLPVQYTITAADGRQCEIYIIAVPENRKLFGEEDLQSFLPVGEKFIDSIGAVERQYQILSEIETPEIGGYYKENVRCLGNLMLFLSYYMGYYMYPDGMPTAEEWAERMITVREPSRTYNICVFDPTQAMALLDETVAYYVEYASQKIVAPELLGVRMLNSEAVSTGTNAFTIYLPEGVDLQQAKNSAEYTTTGTCKVTSAGAWAFGKTVFLSAYVRDRSTDAVYDGTSKYGSIPSKNYSLKILQGDPEFFVSSFLIGGRTATIDQENKMISLNIANGLDWEQKPEITYTATEISYLDENGAAVEPDAEGRIDFSKAKTLLLVNDLSEYVSGEGSAVYEKRYALNITQGNSGACKLLSFSLGAEGEAIEWTGSDITVTIPYATAWDSLAAQYTLSYDAAWSAPSGEDFANSAATPITYRVTAQNGISYQDYFVRVVKTPAATGNRILSFKDGYVEGAIDQEAGTISLTLPKASSKQFAPDIELSDFATVSPASGVKQDFTSPAQYTVTAQNGATKTYTVSVSVSEEEVENPREGEMEGLLANIIASYHTNAEDDWEWMNLGVYGKYQSGSSELNNDGFDITKEIADLNVGTSGTMTDIDRLIMMLTARGYNCTNLAQYNDGQPFADKNGNEIDNLINSLESTSSGGINGFIFGLIALDMGNYSLPADATLSREFLVESLLDHEYLSDGWGVDMVGMLMYALGPYQDDPVYGERVKAKMDEGVEVVLGEMRPDYLFESWGTINSEAAAQAICALSSAGVDCSTDPRFGNGEINVITQWLDRFAVNNSAFLHTAEDSVTTGNMMATYESCYALQWYLGFLENGGNGVPYYLYYHLRDFSEQFDSAADITAFTLEGKAGTITEAAAEGGTNTIAVTLPTGTPLDGMTPELTLSDGATLQAPNLPVTFAAGAPQPFTVLAEDGVTTKTYYVTVTFSGEVQAGGAELEGGSIVLKNSNQMVLSILDKTVTQTETGADILISVNAGVNASALRISADISYHATATPALDGASNLDLSDWATFTIVSEDGTNTSVYRIKVVPKTQASITGFTLTIGGAVYSGVIDNSANTITVTLPFDTDITKVAPVVQAASGAVVSPVSGEVVNLANGVVYTVTNGEEVREYTVEVILEKSVSDQLWDAVAEDNTIADHQVSYDNSTLSGRRH